MDLALLCLGRRPAAAAPIGPLVWEPPNATGAALKSEKKKKKKKEVMDSGVGVLENSTDTEYCCQGKIHQHFL